MALYDSLFTMMDMTAAQLLVTAVGLMHRTSPFSTLLHQHLSGSTAQLGN